MKTVGFRAGLVLFLHSKNKRDYKTTVRQVSSICTTSGIHHVNASALRVSVERLVKNFAKFRNYTRDWDSITNFLLSSYEVPTITEAVEDPRIDAASTSIQSSVGVTDESAALPASGMKSRSVDDCRKCEKRKDSMQALLQRNRTLKLRLALSKKSESGTVRKLKQALSRKQTIEGRLRTDSRTMKLLLAAKERQVKYLLQKSGKPTKEKRKKLKVRKPTSEVKSLQKQLSDLQRENEDMQLHMQEMVEDRSATATICARKDNKTFSASYRKAAYCCLLNQVPVDSTASVISTVVKEVTGLRVDCDADSSTVSQFAYELGILNDIQVGEALEQADNFNLAWDATSLDAEHVNEVHINLAGEPPKGMILQIDTLPGGTAADYVDHITRSLDDITQTFSMYHRSDPVEMHESVIGKMKSTLSDRVIVNHCVRVQLEEKFNIELLELKCNVHPLDGLASEARKTMKSLEATFDVKGNVFGREAAAVNLTYGLSKMRYKNGKGDPKGFKQFMKMQNIKSKMIVRYVGNRMHVLFHLAGVFYFLRAKLLEYLQKYCNNNTSFKTSLVKDMQNNSILLQLKALGLLGKLLTGPWMTVLYGNKSKSANLGMVPVLKKCVNQLKVVLENPMSMLDMREDMFGQALHPADDEILADLQRPSDPPKELELILTKLLEGSVKVLERQLKPYLTGELSSPTSEMLQLAKSAPVHNIFSEQVLGMTDHQYHRAPNATMGFIDGKVKAAKNRTLTWLSSKEEEEQERLVAFAVTRARKMRVIRKKREEQMEQDFHQRQRDKVQKKDQQYRNKVEKRVKLMMSGTEVDFGQELSDTLASAEAKLQTVRCVVDDPSWLTDKYIDHIWFENNIDATYHGKILTVLRSRNKPLAVSVAYWSTDEREEDAEDYRMNISQIITDYLLGDLIFLEM